MACQRIRTSTCPIGRESELYLRSQEQEPSIFGPQHAQHLAGVFHTSSTQTRFYLVFQQLQNIHVVFETVQRSRFSMSHPKDAEKTQCFLELLPPIGTRC